MADLVGHTLGNYRIEAPLGSGGMGEVYRAMHTRLNRPAAIKVLHAMQAADASFQARFLREARAAAALSHPNIVEVFDFGEQDGASYLVMELIPDGSLRTLLRQRATGQGWTLGLGVDLVRQAAEGLAYAHAHGMVHRDVKPDNLLLQKLDLPDVERRDAPVDRYLLKISDFGLARLVDEGGELTVTGMVMGTPTYMSPEQCQGGELDGRSDLYSLGVVLYEVATGAPPFRVKSLSEAVFKHISTPPEPPSALQPDLPIALEEVILRCLAKRPEDRYATGVELAEALDGALGDTELRTVITARRPDLPATPTPAVSAGSLASATLPTEAASGASKVDAADAADAADETAAAPEQPPRTPTPPKPKRKPKPKPKPTPAPAHPPIHAPVRTPIPARAAAATHDESDDQATVAAGPADAADPAESLSARLSRTVATLSALRPRWPQTDDAEATVAVSSARQRATDTVRALLARPRAQLGAGAGAVAFVILLIVVIAVSAHNGQGAKAANSAATHSHATAPAKSAPTPTATPAVTIAYQNSLNSFSAQWPRSARSYFANGGYEINGAWIDFAPAQSTSDGVFSVRMRQLGGPNDQFYGILFRSENDNLFYFFGIAQNQQWTFSLIQNGNGTPIVAPTTDTHINTALNASNTIAARAEGGHFVFYINGAQVGQADDSRLSAGRAGLINTSGDLQVVYNDFTVSVPAQ